MPEKVRVGIVGCGAVSHQYLTNLARFPIVEIVALSDLIRERCENRAKEFGLGDVRVCTTEEMMKDERVDVVLNLAWPKAHVPVAMQAVKAGRHMFSEKPLGTSFAEAKKLVTAARKKGVLVGCAPDTFLGAGIQTARKAIDDGWIGRPVAFTAFVMSRGVETWHPNPPFYYAPGGGPMLDMGPYYLTALVNLLGPIRRVGGFAKIAIPDRHITHKNRDGTPGPMFGQDITVTTPDHICGTIEFENGCVGTIITSFAAHCAIHDGRQPITIWGTDGTLKVPDPNGFDGPVQIRRPGDDDWSELPHCFIAGYGRGVGLADMCHAIRSGRPYRANVSQAFAVMEAMTAFLKSSESGRAIAMKLPYERPAPMPANLPFGILDE